VLAPRFTTAAGAVPAFSPTRRKSEERAGNGHVITAIGLSYNAAANQVIHACLTVPHVDFPHTSGRTAAAARGGRTHPNG
jgi:hypothetical protein